MTVAYPEDYYKYDTSMQKEEYMYTENSVLYL